MKDDGDGCGGDGGDEKGTPPGVAVTLDVGDAGV